MADLGRGSVAYCSVVTAIVVAIIVVTVIKSQPLSPGLADMINYPVRLGYAAEF